MRLVVVNPNTSASVTETIAKAARGAAGRGTEIEAVTAPFGAAYIGTLAPLRRPGAVRRGADRRVHRPRFRRRARADAVPRTRHGGSGDSHRVSVGWALFDRHDHSPSRAGAPGDDRGLRPRAALCERAHNLQADLARNPAPAARALLAIAQAAVTEDGAEVVILGGALLAGLAERLAANLPVPLLDGVTCGVRLAEMLVQLNAGKSQSGSFALPPHKDRRGLAPALARLYEGRVLAGGGGGGDRRGQPSDRFEETTP